MRAGSQFSYGAEKNRLTTKATKYHEGFWSQGLPSCTFVALVVNGFAKLSHFRMGGRWLLFRRVI
jgi:hypothetical protein